MRYLLLVLSALLLLLPRAAQASDPDSVATRYRAFFPQGACHPEAFRLAWEGYEKLKADGYLQNTRYLSIVDFSKPSHQRRFFVLDVPARRLALSSVTAHGVGSDPDSVMRPLRFSNRNNSRMSSLGFYITGAMYYNHRPDDSLGLCLFGLEKGYNDSAAIREIVIHYGATERSGYVYVDDWGAARSFGCPALPLATNARIIRMIAGGSCLFVYSDLARDYASKSAVLQGKVPKRIVQRGPAPNYCSCDLRKGQHKATR